MPFCPNCGKSLPDYASFCSNCGTKINFTQASAAAPAAAPAHTDLIQKRWPMPVVLCAVLYFLMLNLTIYLDFSYFDQSDYFQYLKWNWFFLILVPLALILVFAFPTRRNPWISGIPSIVAAVSVIFRGIVFNHFLFFLAVAFLYYLLIFLPVKRKNLSYLFFIIYAAWMVYFFKLYGMGFVHLVLVLVCFAAYCLTYFFAIRSLGAERFSLIDIR